MLNIDRLVGEGVLLPRAWYLKTPGWASRDARTGGVAPVNLNSKALPLELTQLFHRVPESHRVSRCRQRTGQFQRSVVKLTSTARRAWPSLEAGFFEPQVNVK